MAIDRKVFIQEMTVLLRRFGRQVDPSDPVGREVMKRYGEYLDAHLSTDAFVFAARNIFNEDTFFPTPKRFVEVAAGANDEQIEAAWHELQRTLASHGHMHGFEKLPDRLKGVCRANPGLWKRAAEAGSEAAKRRVKTEFVESMRAALTTGELVKQ